MGDKEQAPIDNGTADKTETTKEQASADMSVKEEPKAIEHASYQDLENKLNETEEKLNEALSSLENYKNQLLRAKAETDNVRKRAEKDIANAHKYSLERLITDLLTVIDSIERGLSVEVGDNEFAKRMYEGMEMTQNLFLKTLAKAGVKAVNPLKETFNPELHQAISMQEDENAPPNSVLQVLQKGYLLNDRLIRPALVVVVKAKT